MSKKQIIKLLPHIVTTFLLFTTVSFFITVHAADDNPQPEPSANFVEGGENENCYSSEDEDENYENGSNNSDGDNSDGDSNNGDNYNTCETDDDSSDEVDVEDIYGECGANMSCLVDPEEEYVDCMDDAAANLKRCKKHMEDSARTLCEQGIGANNTKKPADQSMAECMDGILYYQPETEEVDKKTKQREGHIDGELRRGGKDESGGSIKAGGSMGSSDSHTDTKQHPSHPGIIADCTSEYGIEAEECLDQRNSGSPQQSENDKPKLVGNTYYYYYYYYDDRSTYGNNQ